MENHDGASRTTSELKGELIHALFRLKTISFQRVGHHHGFGPRFGRRHREECGSEFGLNMTEFAFLKRLLMREAQGESGGAWLSEMSDYLCVSKAAVSQMVGSLESKGLITREADPGNRRTIIVKATADGHEMVGRIEQGFDSHLNRIIERVGEKDTREIIRLVNKFAGVVEDIMEEEKVL